MTPHGAAMPHQTIDKILIDKFHIHKDFVNIFLDAFILITKEKKILKFNSAFCRLVELRAIDIKKLEYIDKILITKTPHHKQTAINQILHSNKSIRIDEVLAQNVINKKTLNLILSSYPYFDQNKKIIGSCLLLRNITAERTLQTKYKKKSIESITDALTGLYTRRFFETQIEKEISRCKDKHVNPNFCVMMIDLDKFKSINDTYGHQAGDYVIKETAKILKRNSRRSDILARYGGEELLALVFDADENISASIAEKFRTIIESHSYVFEGKKISVTTSIGLTLVKHYYDKKDLAIKRADGCLYYAKHHGRNLSVADFGHGKKKVKDLILHR